MEVVDPEDKVLGARGAARALPTAKAAGKRDKLTSAACSDDLVWHRVRYRFEYADPGNAALEGAESIRRLSVCLLSTSWGSILPGRRPGRGSVHCHRFENALIAGRSSVRIELLAADQKPAHSLRGTASTRAAQRKRSFGPAGLVARISYATCRYALGATEFLQQLRLEDKVSILPDHGKATLPAGAGHSRSRAGAGPLEPRRGR